MQIWIRKHFSGISLYTRLCVKRKVLVIDVGSVQEINIPYTVITIAHTLDF